MTTVLLASPRGLLARALGMMLPMTAPAAPAGAEGYRLDALRAVLVQYEISTVPDAAPAAPRPMKIAFPMLVTPYGIAAVILLLVLSHDASRVSVC